MILSPVKAIEQGWVKGEISPDAIQPNGIDFTIDRIFQADQDQSFSLFADRKIHRKLTELPTYAYPGTDKRVWALRARTSYDFMSSLHVEVPTGVAAMLVIRSTAARGFLMMTSGVYDSGFVGQIGAVLHNLADSQAVIEQGARIGQIVFYDAANAGSYNGSYQDLKGHWTAGQ